MKHRLHIVTLMLMTLSVSLIHARSFRVAQLPNGNVNGCANCHVSAGGGGTRTAFGELVLNSYLDGSGNVLWGSALAAEDSDGDGYSNGHELEDPFGIWSSGASAPGNPNFVSNPGSSGSTSPTDAQDLSLHFAISEMGPHTGQLFQIRVENSSTSNQVAFEELATITETAFNFTFMHILEMGESYDVELWSDHNGNGVYDAPPTDHSWRVTLTDVSDNASETFVHNTNFTDIGSPLGLDEVNINPTAHILHHNFPNPFNPETKISFTLTNSESVELNVYDIRGQRVATLFSGAANAGSHTYSFNAQTSSGQVLDAGIYFYRLETANGVFTQRMTLLK